MDQERREITRKGLLTALMTAALAIFAFPTSLAYFLMAFLLAPIMNAGFTPVFTEEQYVHNHFLAPRNSSMYN